MSLPLAAACFGPRRPKTARRGWVNSGSSWSTSKATDVEWVWLWAAACRPVKALNFRQGDHGDPHRLDEIGIAGTRLNATVLQQVLLEIGCDVAPLRPAHTIDDARELLDDHHIVVMGGTVPGHTTDTVAVKLAAAVHARHCIIATNVSHVFTKDPRHHDDAEALTEISLNELENRRRWYAP